VDAPHWLHELRTELVRRKLPPLYVERLVSEMTDHFTDCMEDRMSTDARDLHGVFESFGSPAEVARSAAAEFRKAKFSRRHPVLMFLVLPVLSLPLLWFGKVALVVALIKLFGLQSDQYEVHSTVWQAADVALPYVIVSLTVIPVAIAATFFCYLARRAAVNWRWTLAACSLLAVIGGAAIAQLALPTATSKGSLTFGFGISTQPSASQILQFLLPLAICGWAIWRQLRAGERPSQLA
jgi:hypothetical protein